VATKKAAILNDNQLGKFLAYVSESKTPERDRAMVLLSFKAALRSAEIAGLDWDDVLDPEGNIGQLIPVDDESGKITFSKSIWVPGDIAKKGRERRVPLHPMLETALRDLYAVSPARGRQDAVIYGVAGPRLTPNRVQWWFKRRYSTLGLEGASSHSGRRTFITRAARLAQESKGVSLRDVQNIAGHARLQSTELYIEPSAAVDALVSQL